MGTEVCTPEEMQTDREESQVQLGRRARCCQDLAHGI